MRPVRAAACFALIGSALVLLLVRPDTAQEKTAAGSPAGKSVDISYVTDDFFAAVVAQPAKLWKSAGLKGLPLDQASSALKEQVGLEPRQVEQVMLLVPRPEKGLFGEVRLRRGEEPPPLPLPLGGVIRLSEPAASKELLARTVKLLGWGELKAVERAGKTYWKSTKVMEVAVYLPDERTIVFGSETLLGSMMVNLVPGGKLAGLLKKADASADVLAVVDPAPIREALAAESRYARGGEQVVVSAVMQVLRRVEAYGFSADFSQGTRFRWEIVATSETDAELLYDLLRGWQAVLKLALPGIMEQLEAEDDSGFQAEASKLLGRIATDVLSNITTSRKDDRVVMQLEMKGSYAELLASAAKTVAAAREEAKIVASMNNLRQLGLAIHNYHDTMNELPPQAIYEADETRRVKPQAKPLLSWRVSVLPYLEYSSLHGEFHLDEPWDSPHNKKLIAKMPVVFKSPGHDLSEGKTCYVLPLINEGKYVTMIPQKLIPGARPGQGTTTFGSITDGLSNTLMIVEAAPEKAVIWTKPDDWEVDVKSPKEGLFGGRKGFALAIRGDASALRISGKVSAETLLKALGRADAERYDRDELALPTSSVKKRVTPSRYPFDEKTKTYYPPGKAAKTEAPPRASKTEPPRREFKTPSRDEPRKTF